MSVNEPDPVTKMQGKPTVRKGKHQPGPSQSPQRSQETTVPRLVALQMLSDPLFQKELGPWTASSCEHLWSMTGWGQTTKSLTFSDSYRGQRPPSSFLLCSLFFHNVTVLLLFLPLTSLPLPFTFAILSPFSLCKLP